jgi:hypothetical protein
MKKRGNCFAIIGLTVIVFFSCVDRHEKNTIGNTAAAEQVMENVIGNTAITEQVMEEIILYPLEINGKEGFINQFGTLVVEPQFHRAFKSECGVAAGMEGGISYYLDTDGNILFYFENHGRWPHSFSDDLLRKYLTDNEQGGGFVDKFGNFVIPPMYRKVEDFSEGLAFVTDYGNVNKLSLSVKASQQLDLWL